MKAIMFAAQSIELGQNEVVVAGGMENMSSVPYYDTTGRDGGRMGHRKLLDGMISDGLWCVYNDYHMGNIGEICAAENDVTREQQDEYAELSATRALEAQKSGVLAAEITPVSIPQRRGDPVIYSEDETTKGIKLDKIRKLKPAFKRDGGTVTAANASVIADGAAAVIVTSVARAKKEGYPIQAIIKSYADAALKPEHFPVAPEVAVRKALERAGLGDPADLPADTYFEVNEAFSVVVLANAKLLSLPLDRTNIYGGGVSIGHPLGASGARIMVTLMNVLNQKSGTLGVAGICNGGGGASAMVIEKV